LLIVSHPKGWNTVGQGHHQLQQANQQQHFQQPPSKQHQKHYIPLRPVPLVPRNPPRLSVVASIDDFGRGYNEPLARELAHLAAGAYAHTRQMRTGCIRR
jgi:hypothetical protein